MVKTIIKKGFALIELIIVIAIIAILISATAPSLIDYIQNIRDNEIIELIKNIIYAQETHYSELGYFANKINDLGVDTNKNNNYTVSLENMDNNKFTVIKAVPQDEDIKGYIAGLEAITKTQPFYFEYTICQARRKGLKAFLKEEVELKKKRIKCEHSKKII